MKLIWSKADTNDTSYENPSVFGHAVFYEVGRTDIPTPVAAVAVVPTSAPTAAPTETPTPQRFVSVNQTGYFPDGEKFAVYPTAQAVDHVFDWNLVDSTTGEAVASGQTLPAMHDTASGDFVNLIDFSSFAKPGMYMLKVADASSVPFKIGSDIYSQLTKDSLRYFYLNRSGIALDPKDAGDWARPAGHTSDSKVTCFKGNDASGQAWPGCDYTVNAGGGWYDAGDYGKYVVNGGISAWTLMNIYEFNPKAFADGTLTIPENSNGFPDVLDEANWEMNFLLEMQVPDGQPQAGMAFHKLHATVWDGLPSKPSAQVSDRFLMPPSTAATLNLAATAAQCARIWKSLDHSFSQRCLTAAERAWKAANDNPIFTYGNIPGNGGGNYDDANVQDEFFWAAAELYLTTGEQQYHDYVVKSSYFAGKFSPGQESAIYWGDVGVLGTMALSLAPDRLTADENKTVDDLLVKIADHYANVTEHEGYRVAMPPNGYSWGSNSNVLNNAMVMAYAYRLTNEARYLNAVAESMDYVLGRNGLNFSFVSGYGTNAVEHPHHRFWADQPSQGYPLVPPGAIVGGPNAHPADPAAQVPEIEARAPSKRYIDDMQSYSTNEVAINWNAPLAWVAAFLNAHYNAS